MALEQNAHFFVQLHVSESAHIDASEIRPLLGYARILQIIIWNDSQYHVIERHYSRNRLYTKQSILEILILKSF